MALAVIRLALDHGWEPDVRGPQFRLAVQSGELPESVKKIARHFDWCCGQRVMELARAGKPPVPGTWCQAFGFGARRRRRRSGAGVRRR